LLHLQEKREIHPQAHDETDAPGKANSKECLIAKNETQGVEVRLP
jgi:hypothetical protein